MSDPETCTHGVVFDEAEAKRIMAETPRKSTGDAAVDFILGPVDASAEIRKRWPRKVYTTDKPCTCGFVGIAYASYAHMLYGDW